MLLLAYTDMALKSLRFNGDASQILQIINQIAHNDMFRFMYNCWMLTLKGPVPYIYIQDPSMRLTTDPLICAALEPRLSRTPHAVGPHMSRGFVPSRADARRGSIAKSVKCGFARSRKPLFPSKCRGFRQLGQDTQAVNPASIHLCPIAHV